MQPAPFGRYTLCRRLGAGGMGEAFLAVERNSFGADRFVVIKRLLPSRSGNVDDVQMFVAEARLAALLAHSNIVQLYDVGRHAGHYFIAMEYVHGVDLRELRLMAREAEFHMPLAFVVGVGIEVCRGLVFAHTKQAVDGTPLDLVHRDISPANLVVATSGEVKILDFGVAKSALEPRTTHLVAGKAAYMAPELALGRAVDGRCDIYSLGVVLYELATGERPFPPAVGDHGPATAEDLAKGHLVEPPRSKRPDIPEDLERVLLRSLATEPDERFMNADEMAAALMDAARKHHYDVSPGARVEVLRSLLPAERLAPPSLSTRAQHVVLMVGDAAAFGGELRAALEERYRCLTAANDVEARNIFESELIDAVVLLAGDKAWELALLRWVAATYPTTVRFFLSGTLHGDVLLQAINVGRVDRIYALSSKPREIQEGVREMLEESHWPPTGRSSAFPTIPPPGRRSAPSHSASAAAQRQTGKWVGGWSQDTQTLEREVSRVVEKDSRASLLLYELPLLLGPSDAETSAGLARAELGEAAASSLGPDHRVLMAHAGRFAVLLGEEASRDADETGRRLASRFWQLLWNRPTSGGIRWAVLEVSGGRQSLRDVIDDLEWREQPRTDQA